MGVFQVMAEMSRQWSDHELVADAQAGDAQALDTLIAAVRPAVFRYCRSRLATYAGGVDAADDVTQETCIAVVKVLPSYRRQGPPFAAFVYAIASHKVADMQRRFSRSALLVEEFPDQTEPSPTPEDQAIATFDVRAANQLLALLPHRMREVLVLRAAGLPAAADRRTARDERQRGAGVAASGLSQAARADRRVGGAPGDVRLVPANRRLTASPDRRD